MKLKYGYFLIEALLSIVIFAMLILSIFSVISFLQRRVVRSSLEAEAALLLQEGVEIAHSTLLSDWRGYPPSTYFPVFNVSTNAWVLLPGEETGLEARFNRKIELKDVCRDAQTGEILTSSSPCLGAMDPLSREVVATVSWTEKGVDRAISTRLLILNTNE
jgi:type II secretory pathway pseudopilin PulG